MTLFIGPEPMAMTTFVCAGHSLPDYAKELVVASWPHGLVGLIGPDRLGPTTNCLSYAEKVLSPSLGRKSSHRFPPEFLLPVWK